MTLLTGFGDEESFADALLKSFNGRRVDAREFALQNRVLLLQTHAGIAIDVAFGGFPFEERSVRRASQWEWAANHVL